MTLFTDVSTVWAAYFSVYATHKILAYYAKKDLYTVLLHVLCILCLANVALLAYSITRKYNTHVIDYIYDVTVYARNIEYLTVATCSHILGSVLLMVLAVILIMMFISIL